MFTAIWFTFAASDFHIQKHQRTQKAFTNNDIQVIFDSSQRADSVPLNFIGHLLYILYAPVSLKDNCELWKGFGGKYTFLLCLLLVQKFPAANLEVRMSVYITKGEKQQYCCTTKGNQTVQVYKTQHRVLPIFSAGFGTLNPVECLENE